MPCLKCYLRDVISGGSVMSDEYHYTFGCLLLLILSSVWSDKLVYQLFFCRDLRGRETNGLKRASALVSLTDFIL
jgi:hypothetical protein